MDTRHITSITPECFILTTHIRRMGEGNVFTRVCLSVHTCRGVPHPADGGYPIPGLDGGTQSKVWMGGTFIPGPDGRLPHPADRGTPIQDYDQGGTPGLDGVPLPSRTRWGTPIQDCMGYLPVRRQTSIASTCYTAGCMPLVFTQEDFPVLTDTM